MSMLFTPLKIKNIQFKNRLVVSPMCMYSSTRGFATDFHLVHYGQFALGGFGLIMQEATAVSPEGRITHQDMGIWKDAHIDRLKEIVTFVHNHGAKMGIQLAHAGRKASHLPPHLGRKEVKPHEEKGWQKVSASAIPYHEEDTSPIALDEKGIHKVKEDFVAATKRAVTIGYDVLEIHAAHGYLLHQFLSPLSNKRTDEYGGSFENRIRSLIEIVEMVKEEWPEDKPLFVRISATDWMTTGWTINDSITLAKRLKELGVDLIDTSTGGNYPVKIPLSPGYQVEFSKEIKRQAEIQTGAVGLITEATQSEEILQKGEADLIFYARKALRDPFFPLRFASELASEIEWPVQYLRGKER